MVLLATPFRKSTAQPFSFGPGGVWPEITAEIRAQIPIMLQHRLTPPPRETYSLNRFVFALIFFRQKSADGWACARKLSGSFLLASRLGGTFDTRAVWDKVVEKYEFGPETSA